MSSRALKVWRGASATALDEIEAAHRARPRQSQPRQHPARLPTDLSDVLERRDTAQARRPHRALRGRCPGRPSRSRVRRRSLGLARTPPPDTHRRDGVGLCCSEHDSRPLTVRRAEGLRLGSAWVRRTLPRREASAAKQTPSPAPCRSKGQPYRASQQDGDVDVFEGFFVVTSLEQ